MPTGHASRRVGGTVFTTSLARESYGYSLWQVCIGGNCTARASHTSFYHKSHA